jgi:hypothetical protein
MGTMRNAYKILVGKREGNTSLGRPRRRCEGNIRMDLRETGVGTGHVWPTLKLMMMMMMMMMMI